MGALFCRRVRSVIALLIAVGAPTAVAQDPRSWLQVRPAAGFVGSCPPNAPGFARDTHEFYQCRPDGTGWDIVQLPGAGGASSALQGADVVTIDPDMDDDDTAQLMVAPVDRHEDRELKAHGYNYDSAPDPPLAWYHYPWPEFQLWNPRRPDWLRPVFAFALDMPDYSENPGEAEACSHALPINDPNSCWNYPHHGFETEHEGAWPLGDSTAALRIMSNTGTQAGHPMIDNYAGLSLESYRPDKYGTRNRSTSSLWNVDNYDRQNKFVVRMQGDYNNDGTLDRSDFGYPDIDFDGSGPQARGIWTGDDMSHDQWSTLRLIQMYDSTNENPNDPSARPGMQHAAQFTLNFKDVAPCTTNGCVSAGMTTRFHPQQQTTFKLYPDWQNCGKYLQEGGSWPNDTDPYDNTQFAIQTIEYNSPESVEEAGGRANLQAYTLCLGAIPRKDAAQEIEGRWNFDMEDGQVTGSGAVTFDDGFRAVTELPADEVDLVRRRVQVGPIVTLGGDSDLGPTRGAPYLAGDNASVDPEGDGSYRFTPSLAPGYRVDADGGFDYSGASWWAVETWSGSDPYDYEGLGKPTHQTGFNFGIYAWDDLNGNNLIDPDEKGRVDNGNGRLRQLQPGWWGGIEQWADPTTKFSAFAALCGTDLQWVLDFDNSASVTAADACVLNNGLDANCDCSVDTADFPKVDPDTSLDPCSGNVPEDGDLLTYTTNAGLGCGGGEFLWKTGDEGGLLTKAGYDSNDDGYVDWAASAQIASGLDLTADGSGDVTSDGTAVRFDVNGAVGCDVAILPSGMDADCDGTVDGGQMADDTIWVGTGSDSSVKTLPDCDGDGSTLQYDQSSNAFSCGDDDAGTAGSASEIDADEDGTPEVEADGTVVGFDPDDDGTLEAFVSNTDIRLPLSAPTCSVQADHGRLAIQPGGAQRTLEYCVDDGEGMAVRYTALADAFGTAWYASTATAANALTLNGANCSAGQYARGVSAAGAAEDCTADDDAPDSDGEVPDAITVNWTGLQTYPTACTAGNHVSGVGDTLTCTADDDTPDSDAEVPDSITVDWTGLQNYPTACTAGNYVSGVGDTLTCTALPADDDVPDAGEVSDTALAAGAVDGGAGGEIADGSITADDLAADAVTPDKVLSAGQTDEYCLTYEATGDTWAWQSCGTGGGTIDGSGGAGQVTYWSDADTITGEAAFSYDASTNTLSVGVLATDDPGDGSRQAVYTDNTSDPAAPASGQTALYAKSNKFYLRHNGGSAELLLAPADITGDASASSTGAITINANSVALGTDTTGDYLSSATASQGLLVTGTEAASIGLIDCAANEILKRDSGDTAWACAADATGGGGSNAFGTISVSGQSDVVADAAPDTVTFVAGSNITITTNATNDSVTIAAAAGGPPSPHVHDTNGSPAARWRFTMPTNWDSDGDATVDALTAFWSAAVTRDYNGNANESAIVYSPKYRVWISLKNAADSTHGMILSADMATLINTFDFPAQDGANVDSEGVTLTDPMGDYFYVSTEGIGSGMYVIEYSIQDALAGGNITPLKQWTMDSSWCSVSNSGWEGVAFVPDKRYGPTNWTRIPRGYFISVCQGGSTPAYKFTLDTDAGGNVQAPTLVAGPLTAPCGLSYTSGIGSDYDWDTGLLWFGAASDIGVADANLNCVAKWTQGGAGDIEGIALGNGYLAISQDTVGYVEQYQLPRTPFDPIASVAPQQPLRKACTQTREGETCWDYDDDKLTIGTGSGTQSIGDPQPLKVVDMMEEFVGGNLPAAGGDATLGQYGWRWVRAGTSETALYGSSDGHPGTLVMSTTANTTDAVALFKNTAANGGIITPYATAATVETQVRYGNSGQVPYTKMLWGLSGSTTPCNDDATNQIVFYVTSGASAGNWRYSCKAGANETDAETNPAVAASDAWQHLKVVFATTGVTFYINGTQVGSCTTTANIPGSAMDFTLSACNQTSNTAAKTVSIDFMRWTQTLAAAR